ncbi:hypothetical protein ACOZ38_37405 [Sphaerisporangium viridialbum]|uniref:hypothetical protein n=1 Tax=Sphaerisporangium viridialbum TaxID=46189 RepID=UPI003C73C70B
MTLTDHLSPEPSVEGPSPAPPATRGNRAIRAAGRHLLGFSSGVAVAVTAALVLQAIKTWPSGVDEISIDVPLHGSHAKVTPCLRVSGHGTSRPGTKQVIAVQQTDATDSAITFFTDVRIVGEEWQITVPLEGPEDSWFRVRSVVLSTKLADYLESVGGSVGRSRWISPTMPPGSAITDSVDVQRGPGQIC